MAAGLGTRMKSDTAKVLHKIAGRPMLHWVVTAARAAGAERVVAILGHQHEAVKASLDASFGAGAVDVALQPEQRGTGHAVQCALPAVANEPDDRIVVILTGDAPLLASERIAELVAACASVAGRHGAALDGARSRRCRTAASCATTSGVLEKIVEHPDATPEQRKIQDTNAGFYAIRLGHLRKDLADAARRQREGRALPDRPRRARRTRAAARPSIDAPFAEVSGHQRSRRPRGGRDRGAPPHQRALDARGRHDGRSAQRRTSTPTSARSARTSWLAPERRAARQDHDRRRRAHRSPAACSPTSPSPTTRTSSRTRCSPRSHGRRARRRSARSRHCRPGIAARRGRRTSATSSRPRRRT